MTSSELRVLVIDDDPDDAFLIQDLLSDVPGNDIRCTWVSDPQKGLEALVARQSDVCLLDYRLGKLDGLTLLRQARERGSDTPVILLTGQGSRDLGLEALEAGVADYLVKSRFDAATLERAIRYTLQQKRYADHLEHEVEARTTELTRANSELRTSEERYRLLVEGATGFAIIMLDLGGHVTSWNVGAQRLFGYEEEEVLGSHFSCFFRPEDVAAGFPERELAQARQSEIGSDDNLLVRKDGTRFWASGATTALRDEASRLRGYSKIVRDVTERKRAEEALQEADRHKNEYLAMLAHELRNPLGAIMNAVRVIRLADGEITTVLSASQRLERQAAQMVRLVDDLLDVSRISRGKIELRLQRVDLADAMNLAADTARSLPEGAGVDLEVRTPSSPVAVHADPARLAQIIGNLLHNAFKFTGSGGRVVLSGDVEDDEAVIRVRDSGIGIAPEEITRIFEMFAQVDQTLERSRGGLGIGLTLVQHLAELHGGTVEARSDGLDKGSEFIVRIPVMREDEARSTSDDAMPAKGAAPTKRRVLVVDDNRDSADSLALLLTMTGHDAFTAYDGLEAVESARTLAPDVVLLDIGLPKLNGYDAARRIRSEPWGERLVLVALTGWGQEEDRERARASGFDGHLLKPVDHTALFDILSDPARLRSSSGQA